MALPSLVHVHSAMYVILDLNTTTLIIFVLVATLMCGFSGACRDAICAAGKNIRKKNVDCVSCRMIRCG